MYSKASSNADSILHVRININIYFPIVENLIIHNLPNATIVYKRKTTLLETKDGLAVAYVFA